MIESIFLFLGKILKYDLLALANKNCTKVFFSISCDFTPFFASQFWPFRPDIRLYAWSAFWHDFLQTTKYMSSLQNTHIKGFLHLLLPDWYKREEILRCIFYWIFSFLHLQWVRRSSWFTTLGHPNHSLATEMKKITWMRPFLKGFFFDALSLFKTQSGQNASVHIKGLFVTAYKTSFFFVKLGLSEKLTKFEKTFLMTCTST